MTTKTQNEQIEFSLNFVGFYDSLHSEIIEGKIESYDYNFDNVDYKQTNINYCKEYLNRLSEELEIDLTFISLDRPREYNFTTDKIRTEISQQDFNTLLDAYDDKKLFDYIEENSKSYDGFASFYSGYKAVKEEKEIFLQYLFDYILQYESFDFYDLDFEIIETSITNFTFDNVGDNIIK